MFQNVTVFEDEAAGMVLIHSDQCPFKKRGLGCTERCGACRHTNMHLDGYSSFIQSLKLGSNQDVLQGEWIKSLCFIQTVPCYSTLKINDLSSHEKTGRSLKCKLLSEEVNMKRLQTV